MIQEEKEGRKLKEYAKVSEHDRVLAATVRSAIQSLVYYILRIFLLDY